MSLRTTVTFNPGRTPVMLDGYALPREFEAVFEQDDLGRVTLAFRFLNGQLVCSRFEYAATEGHPDVSATDIRTFPLAHWRDEAIQLAAQPIATEAGKVSISYGSAITPRDSVRKVNRVNDEALRRVAELATEHPHGPDDRAGAIVSKAAYEAIQDEFRVERRTAQLWVKRACDRGFLDLGTAPTGEASPRQHVGSGAIPIGEFETFWAGRDGEGER